MFQPPEKPKAWPNEPKPPRATLLDPGVDVLELEELDDEP